MGFKEQRKLSARRMTPRRETLSGKTTSRATVTQNKEALRQPQKSRVELNGPLTRSYTLNGDDGSARSQLQDLRK